MPDLSAHLSLPYLQPAQAQKHVTHNEALQILDAVVQLSVLTQGATTPPADPAEGARHIVGVGATGAWAGQDHTLAYFSAGAWQFLAPQPGWRAFVIDSAQDVIWQGGGWQVQDMDNLPGVGINASADAVNRLAVSAAATLLSHEGAGHQLKLNKAQPGETASLMFQTGWSGRAEMGTTGNDDFAIKVSSDGSTWTTALHIAAATGVPDLAAGALIDGHAACHRGNLLGPVAETGGLPTGAVIERGSNPQGDFVRFADGTQICSAETTVDIDQPTGAVFTSGAVTLDFPRPFAVAPAGSGALANTVEGWVNGRAASSSQWICAGFAPTARTGDVMRLLAVGRWF